MRQFLLPCLWLASLAATAQTTRTVQPTLLWPEAQGEFALKSGDYLLVTLRGERLLTAEAYYSQRRHLGFDAGQVRLGYEHFWNARWSWGGTARFTGGTGQPEVFTPELLLRHRAAIFGGLTFGQRLSLERTFPNTTNYLGGTGPDGQFWTRLRVDVEKILPLGGAAATGPALRPRLSYEAATHLRLQKSATDQDERTIQYTSLRAELGVRLSSHFDFTPWFAYQTQYYVSLPQYQYDAAGNQIQVRGGKANDVYPTVGLDLRFTLLPTGTQADRQQLPTQH